MPKLLVIGDLIVDSYLNGTVDRLAPDFLGYVFDVIGKPKQVLGGAGNVAANLKSLLPDSEIHIQGSIGLEYFELLKDYTVHRVSEETMLKERLIAIGENKPERPRGEQKIIRVDTLKKFSKCASVAPGGSYDYVIVSDYNKGTYTPDYELPKCSMSFIDSKRDDISACGNIDVLKINHHEYARCKDTIRNKTCIVTHGHKPTLLYQEGKLIESIDTYDIDHSTFDFCGAGDSFLAGLVYGQSRGLSMVQSIQIANVVAAIAITKPGTAVVTLDELKKELLLQSIHND